jgi:hypothetical protein
MYEPVKTFLAGALSTPGGGAGGQPPALLHKVLSGVVCGGLAAAVCTPTDVVKVRMMADASASNATPRYKGIAHAFADIYWREGARGLYTGISPTVQRAAVVAAVELASYDECKTLLVQYTGLAPNSKVTHFAASTMAGFLCTIASSPLDVMKSRVMNQPVDAAGRGLTYTSTVDCLRKSVAAEGVASLWKGFWPNFGKPRCGSVGVHRPGCPLYMHLGGRQSGGQSLATGRSVFLHAVQPQPSPRHARLVRPFAVLQRAWARTAS